MARSLCVRLIPWVCGNQSRPIACLEPRRPHNRYLCKWPAARRTVAPPAVQNQLICLFPHPHEQQINIKAFSIEKYRLFQQVLLLQKTREIQSITASLILSLTIPQAGRLVLKDNGCELFFAPTLPRQIQLMNPSNPPLSLPNLILGVIRVIFSTPLSAEPVFTRRFAHKSSATHTSATCTGQDAHAPACATAGGGRWPNQHHASVCLRFSEAIFVVKMVSLSVHTS
jgi:hypothetical protein